MLDREVLEILRSRLHDDAILASSNLLVRLGLNPEQPAPGTATQVRRLIERAVRQLPTDLQQATLMMSGLDPSITHRLTRVDVLERMGTVLPRRRRTPQASFQVSLSKRAIELVEAREIAPNVLRILLSDKHSVHFYSRGLTRISLTKGRNAGRLLMDVDLEVDATGKDWIVALTCDLVTADHICGLAPAVNETLCDGSYFTLPQGEPPTGMRLVAHASNAAPHPTDISFQELSSAEVSAKLGEPLLTDLPNTRWFAAELPERAEAATRVGFATQQDIPLAARYCYWSAPRRMYLERLTVDISHFPNRRKYEFRLQPFLATQAVTSGTEGRGLHELVVEGWIEAGNGAALVWGDPRT